MKFTKTIGVVATTLILSLTATVASASVRPGDGGPLTVTVTVATGGSFGAVPNISLDAADPSITYNPSNEAANISGTLTCSTTATSSSNVGSYPIVANSCSGLSDSSSLYTVVYDEADSSYEVSQATSQDIYNGNILMSRTHAAHMSVQLFYRPGGLNGNTVGIAGGVVSVTLKDKHSHLLHCNTHATGAKGNAACSFSKKQMGHLVKGFGTVTLSYAGNTNIASSTSTQQVKITK